jgi:hypothetical protein
MHRFVGPVIRRLGWDRNPIRRSVDRLQTITTAVLLLLLTVVAPLTGWLMASHAYGDGQRAEHRERAAYRLVPATVIRIAEVRATGAGRFIAETVRLRWPDGRGGTREGSTELRRRARAGAGLPVWINAGGALTHPPRAHGQTRSDTVWAGIAGVTGVAAPGIVIYLMTRRRLDRRRYGQWESDWATTAPLWTRRTS